jgi:hypothetical protein
MNFCDRRERRFAEMTFSVHGLAKIRALLPPRQMASGNHTDYQ